MRPGTPKVDGLIFSAQNKTLHTSAAFSAWWRGSFGRDTGPTGRAGGDNGAWGQVPRRWQCRAAPARWGWGRTLPYTAILSHSQLAPSHTHTSGPSWALQPRQCCLWENGSWKEQNTAWEWGEKVRNCCEHWGRAGEEWGDSSQPLESPPGGSVGQDLWRNPCTHAGGGGDVLKKLWPTPEQRMSMRSWRGRAPNLPVPAGMGSRLRNRNRRVKLSLGKRQREEGVSIVKISPSFSLCQLILTGRYFSHVESSFACEGNCYMITLSLSWPMSFSTLFSNPFVLRRGSKRAYGWAYGGQQT